MSKQASTACYAFKLPLSRLIVQNSPPQITLLLWAAQPHSFLASPAWIQKTQQIKTKLSKPFPGFQVSLNGLTVNYLLPSQNWIDLKTITPEIWTALKSGYEIFYDPKGYLSALCYKFEKKEGTLLEPRIDISLTLAQELISTQFPQWQDLAVEAVELAGWCNGAFRLGQDLVVKIPRAQRYEKSHLIENRWLPKIRPQLPISIPKPVALGQPQDEANGYPWHWSVYQWIEGDTADHLPEANKAAFALDLAQFLKHLWSVDNQDGPSFFEQTFFRGAPLYVYHEESSEALSQLQARPYLQQTLDFQMIKALWESALQSDWNHPPVWVHGDLFPTNILTRQNKLAAVIDFGSMCLGEPACDLAIAWTFFSGQSREIFKNTLALDPACWTRARAWALWKALITLAGLEHKETPKTLELQQLIQVLCQEHQTIA